MGGVIRTTTGILDVVQNDGPLGKDGAVWGVVGGVGGFGGGVGVAVVGGEVGAGDLDGLEQEAGAFEVDVVAGEAGGDQADGVLDGGAVVEVIEQEGVVLDDGGDVVGTVLVAHELVVHGGVAATGAVLFGFVHALVGLGRFAIEGGTWTVRDRSL